MENLKEHLFSMAEEDYKKFSLKLLPADTKLLGVRLPKLRKTAALISKNGLSRDFLDFIYNYECEYFEETMLKGMAIGAVKCGFEDRLRLIEYFVPFIDNWSVCDSFCSSLKFGDDELPALWDFIGRYLESDEEFPARFGYVMIIRFFIRDGYFERVFGCFEELKCTALYAKLAVAWAISVCCVEYAEKTLEFIRNSRLDDFTIRTAVRKIRESYRVSPEAKARAAAILSERK